MYFDRKKLIEPDASPGVLRTRCEIEILRPLPHSGDISGVKKKKKKMKKNEKIMYNVGTIMMRADE